MKFAPRTFLGLGLLAMGVWACASCGSGEEGPPPRTIDKYFAYVVDAGSATVFGFSLDAQTGALSPGAATALPTNLNSQSLAITPSGKFAYIVGSNYYGIYAYSIDPDTGAWSGVPGTPFYPFYPEVRPSGIAIDPSGRFLYFASYEGGAIAIMRINADTGQLSLTTGSPFPVAGGPSQITTEPNGRYAFVMSGDAGTVSTLAINSTTGVLTPVPGSVLAGTNPGSLTVDPQGRRLYVTNWGSRDISAFAIDPATGALTAVAGSPFAVPQPPPFMLFPEAIAVEPLGRTAFVACTGSMTLTSFSVDGATGALATTGVVITTWNSPVAIAVGPTGRHIYVTHGSNPGTITYYEIDPAMGAIRFENALTVGRFPSLLAIVHITQ
jgi:6-phosphogluconolactonase